MPAGAMLSKENREAIDAANTMLRHNLTIEGAENAFTLEDETNQAYQELLELFAENYECYRYGVGYTLATLEKMSIMSFSHSVVLYSKTLYPSLSKTHSTRAIQEVLDIERTDDGIARMMSLYEECLKQGTASLSASPLDVSRYTSDQLKELVSILVYHIQEDCQRTVDWDTLSVTTEMVLLYVLRSVCSFIQDIEVFYHVVNTFLDVLIRKGHNQLARDVAEETVRTSFIDGVPFMGFFCSFKAYSNQHSSQAAFLYGNLYLTALNRIAVIPSTKFLFDMIWQSMKAFRNALVNKSAIDLYRSIPKEHRFSPWEQQSLDSSYFNCLLLERNKGITPELYDYLNREREAILEQGEHACLSWFIIILNLKANSSHFNYNHSGLETYYHLFDSIITDSIAAKYKAMFFGSTQERMELLKSALLKLLATRDKTDFTYDLKEPIKIADQLLEVSYPEENVEGTLLACLLKTDYTFSLVTKPHDQDVSEARLDAIDLGSFYEHYPRTTDTICSLPLRQEDAIVWLLSSPSALKQLVNTNGAFVFRSLHPWSESHYRSTRGDFLQKMNFDTTGRDRNGPRDLFIEDYEEDAKKIASEFYFPKLLLPLGLTRILLVKDVELSETPHNLFQADSGFIALSSRVCNIYSVEWLKTALSNAGPPPGLSIAAYIPTDGGDFTLAMLYSSLESLFTDYSVDIQTAAGKVRPLSSTINVLAMHGDSNISKTHLVYQNQNTFLMNSRQVIGKGRILVLLVCHSGSATEAFQRFEVASFVKPFLVSGYDAVVAPSWALHIKIPPIWMPVFLESLKSGEDVSTAVYKANLAVHREFPTPSAWACMHLYGNPYFGLETSATA